MSKRQRFIRFRGRRHTVLDELRLKGRTYFVLQRLSHGQRKRFLVWAPHIGVRGQMCHIWMLPKDLASMHRLEALGRVSQFNSTVPTILDCGRTKVCVFVICKWIEGPTVRDFLRDASRGRHPWPSTYLACRAFGKLIHGLQRLHFGASAAHGDIRPANLILTRHPLEFVLIDYGSAWCFESGESPQMSDGHHPVYAAPEFGQQGVTADYRADIFSATVIFYELLTGEVPYDRLGGRAAQLPESQIPDWVSPSTILKGDAYGIPASAAQLIDQITRCGLQLDVAKRYSGYPHLLADWHKLKRALELPPEPVVEPWRERWAKFWNRHKN